MTTLLLALVCGAPALKDPPKPSGSIVGEWAVESQTTNGRVVKTTIEQVYTFAADGKWSISRKGNLVGGVNRVYSLDRTGEVPKIDMKLSAAAANPTMFGIVKVDGDRLVLCYSRKADDRPTAFESPVGSTYILITLRRLKKE